MMNGQLHSVPFSITGEKISTSIQQLANQQLGNSRRSLQTVLDIMQSIQSHSTITKEQHQKLKSLLQGSLLTNIKKQLPMQQTMLDQLTNSIQQRPTDIADFYIRQTELS